MENHNGAFAVRVRSWAMCESPEVTAYELLGRSALASPVNLGSAGWRVEDPIPPDDPVGSVRSLVTFQTEAPLEVNIVPGSQGQPAPTEEMGHELVKLTVTREQTLVLDARCWYNVTPSSGIRVSLWLSQPRLVQS